jgi:hypothetical protein
MKRSPLFERVSAPFGLDIRGCFVLSVELGWDDVFGPLDFCPAPGIGLVRFHSTFLP